MNRVFKPALALWCSLTLGSALAERTISNLTPFTTLCLTGAYEEQGKPNDTVLNQLLARFYFMVRAQGVPLASGNCPQKGLGSTGQLNLNFSFITALDGQSFYSTLDGWLSREGKFTSVTLWQSDVFGSMSKGEGAPNAAYALNLLTAAFLQDWTVAHPPP